MNMNSDLDLITVVLSRPTGPSIKARSDARDKLLHAIAIERPANRGSRPVRQRRRVRRPAAIGVVVLGLFSAAAVAATTHLITLSSLIGTHARPAELFVANPEGWGQPGYRYVAVPHTSRLVETVTVPGGGKVQYWTANATHHGICLGLRLANGTWADLTRTPSPIGIGPAPGCIGTTRANGTGANGDGFFWFASELGHGFDGGRLVYGIVHVVSGQATVRDTISGATAPVIDHRYFAIVIPPSHGQIVWVTPNGQRVRQVRYRLETITANGHVVGHARESIAP
jgi:hypothetical protein